jgi:hypothetical protein
MASLIAGKIGVRAPLAVHKNAHRRKSLEKGSRSAYSMSSFADEND